MRGRIKKLLSKIVFDLQAGLETPEAINLIKIFKPQYKVARSRLGSAVFNLHIVGNEDQLTLSNIDGTIDQTTIKGVASEVGQKQARIKGRHDIWECLFQQVEEPS